MILSFKLAEGERVVSQLSHRSLWCTCSMGVLKHWQTNHCWLAFNTSLLVCQCGDVTTDTRLKTLVYCEIQRDLPGGDGLNQHCVNSFGMGLNVMDIHLYLKVPHCSFNAQFIMKASGLDSFLQVIGPITN